MKNIYKNKIRQVLPRVLSFYDNNYVSNNFGSGDRTRWAWGLNDFSNSTYVCSMFGLSCLIKSNFFLNKKNKILKIIDNMFFNIDQVIKNNFGFNESFPNENSFCVTALVADSVIGAFQNLQNILDEKKRKKYFKICTQVINKLDELHEGHAFISNHLATASLAYARYWKITKKNIYKKKYFTLINKILKNQSSEGWYKEYESFDPGYETLTINYLSQILQISENQKLKKSLIKSSNFLSLFILSNNSLGGVYGSRGTEFIFPGGFEILNKEKINFPIQKVRLGIKSLSHATILSVDDMNLIPMFNSYCLGLINCSGGKNIKKNIKINKYFKHSGILLIKNNNFELIINCKKGGCYNYLKNKKLITNYGTLIKYNKKFASTQKYDQNNIIKIHKNKVHIISDFKKINYKSITQIQFIILRILCLSFFKIKFFREKFKILASKILISNNKKIKAYNIREISIFKDGIQFNDKINSKFFYKKINSFTPFSHIHMASRGYWHSSK